MSKVLYYLGAGASANSLPVVNNLAEAINKQQLYLETLLIKNRKQSVQNIDAIEFYQIQLQQLYSACKRFLSIDTFFRALYHQASNNDYQIFKTALSNFLIIEQMLNPIDNRYINFVSSILDSSSFKWPDDIRIASWNYDNQIELAIKYLNYGILDSHNIKNDTPIIDLTNSELAEHSIKATNNTIPKDLYDQKHIAVNGSCGYYYSESNDWQCLIPFNWANQYLYDSYDYVILNGIINSVLIPSYADNIFSSLKFAWEEDSSQLSFGQLGLVNLVVIGYSFPYFNRSIDKKILSSINIESVFIQEIDHNSFDTVKRNLIYSFPELELNGDRIMPVLGKNTPFFIPPFPYDEYKFC